MRGLALAPLAVAAGCLYTGGLNKAPSVQLDPPSATSTFKGATISVTAHASDDTDNSYPLLFGMKYTVASTNIEGPPLGECDVTVSPPGPSTSFTFYRTGTFSITATATDHLGAKSNSATVMVTITDAPPTFVPPSKLMPTSSPNACNLYVAGDTITLGFSGSVVDPDQSAHAVVASTACTTDETLSYTWRITGMPGSARPLLTRYTNNNCVAPDSSSGTTLAVPDLLAQVCLWTDPAMPSSNTMYSVVLDVSDGTSTITSPVAGVPISPDQPPCITGTDPVAGSYVVDRTQTQLFKVDGVFDDRDPFGSPSSNLTFAWSVWRESDPSWRVVPLRSQSTYSLDTSGFLVGEKVRVRVEAIDRTGGRASGCDLNADDCTVTSCLPGGGACHKWKTWDLELR